jgi:hypothetical protein
MKTVYFKIDGRFGNNLFQYFAAEIICKIYNFENVKYVKDFKHYCYVIYNENFINICNKYIKDEKIEKIDTDIFLCGYFQRSEIFSYFREYILTKFTSDNCNYINEKYRICDIVNFKEYKKFDKEDLILHLRLDDFIHQQYNSEILNPVQILEIINNIKYKKLYIICDKIKHDWEYKYLKYFENLNYEFFTNDLLTDFKSLMYSNKMIISNSTFGWLSAYLSNAKEIHIPYNHFHGGFESCGQNLDIFNDRCIVYKNFTYWKEI